MSSLVATGVAAQRLGVSVRQVQRLVDAGVLTQRARGVLDGASVDEHLAARRGAHRRTWSEPTAWGAVAILSGTTPTWMGQTQRSRLAGRLRTMTAAELVTCLRNRAMVEHYSGHRSVVARLRTLVVDTQAGQGRLGMAAASTDVIDGYVATDSAQRLVATLGLVRDPGGQITLRATATSLAVVAHLATTATVLAAADLAGSLDSREASTGLAGLAAALEAHRRA